MNDGYIEMRGYGETIEQLPSTLLVNINSHKTLG